VPQRERGSLDSVQRTVTGVQLSLHGQLFSYTQQLHSISVNHSPDPTPNPNPTPT